MKVQDSLPVGLMGAGCGSCPLASSLTCEAAGAGSAERGRRRGDLNAALSPVFVPGVGGLGFVEA